MGVCSVLGLQDEKDAEYKEQEVRYSLLVFVLVLSSSLFAAGQTLTVAEAPPANVVTSSATPATAPTNPRPVWAGSDGLWFTTQDRDYQLRVHGYLQADDRMFSNDVHGNDPDVFFLRRIRPIFEGTIFGAVDFRFMPDFGQYNPQIQEAYLELKTFPVAKLRVGKFKEPLGLEVLRSDRDLTFAERSLASDLLPLRYMGAQVGGSLFSDSISYQVGYFNGSNDGANGSFEWIHGNEAAARLFFRPFATTGVSALQNFGFGLAGSTGSRRGVISGLKTVGQATFFKYSSTALANGDHTRVSPQAYYFAGPVGIMAEYVLSSQDVLNKKNTGTIDNQAWEVSASVMLTGEKNSYSGVKPRNAFEPTKGARHLGAIELAGRYSHLQIDAGAFPLFANPKTSARQAQEVGVGINWDLNRFVKLTTDYEHTSFRMAVPTLTPLHDENVLASRVQLAF